MNSISLNAETDNHPAADSKSEAAFDQEHAALYRDRE
jgi:hypothetical protein